MIKLLKYLKQSWAMILLLVIILTVQAYCDLTLPGFTADILDVGIQKGGITDTMPKIIRESEMNNLLIFVAKDEKEDFLSAYKLLDAGKLSEQELNRYEDKYPTLKKENLYLLDINKGSDRYKKESEIFSDSVLVLSYFEKMSTDDVKDVISKIKEAQSQSGQKVDMSKMTKEQIQALQAQAKALDAIDTPKELLDMFRGMTEEQIGAMMEGSSNSMKDLPDSILKMAANSYIQREYKAVGIDLFKIQTHYIIWAGIKMLSLALLIMVISVFVVYLAAKIGAALSKRLREDIFKKVVSFSGAELDKFSTASLITRSTNDIQQVQQVVIMMLRMLIYAPILAIGGVIKVLNTNASMTWIIALGVGTILVVISILFMISMPKFKLMQKLVDKLNLVMREIITGLPVIRAFSTQNYEKERFREVNKDLVKTNLFIGRVMSFMMPFMTILMNGLSVLIIWVAAHKINEGNMQFGEMTAFITYTMQIVIAFLMLTFMTIMLPRAFVSAARIDEVIETELTVTDKKDKRIFGNTVNGQVAFENVTFRYPGADEDAISGINFTARPGQVTAIIGSTGCGKSTLVNLIPRFYDVTQGKITIDDIDIRDLSQSELRDQLGYVPQKSILFSGTIESNIKFSNEEMTDEQMKIAAEISQAADFISEKEDTYHSSISQGGGNVSGGQKQRLSIARAVAKQPKIYIFDDSFSALDYKTDVALRKALSESTGESTVIIVAQRINTILRADQIIVLDEGQIVGMGTHGELLTNCEVYRQIASSQLSESELNQVSGEEARPVMEGGSL